MPYALIYDKQIGIGRLTASRR